MKPRFRTAFFTAAAIACAAAPLSGATSSGRAVLRLLDSRAAGDATRYTEAAAIVAAEAARGGAVQQFVIAAVSQFDDAPASVRIDAATRERYIAASRPLVEAAAKKGSAMAWYLIAVADNDRDALERAIALGNVQAMNVAGTEKIESDPREAFALFSAAAETGDANALYNRGFCLEKGIGTERDAVAAFECFRRAADEGHPGALNNLGAMYREGRGTERDPAKAMECFRRAAIAGGAQARINLAMMLVSGEAGRRDARKGLLLLESVAAKGDAVAAETLSRCYADGAGGLEPDSRLSAWWLVFARALKGDANASRWLEANPKEGK